MFEILAMLPLEHRNNVFSRENLYYASEALGRGPTPEEAIRHYLLNSEFRDTIFYRVHEFTVSDPQPLMLNQQQAA